MPRFLRIPVTLFCFFLFFAGSPVLGLVVFPLLRPLSRSAAEHRRRVTRWVNRAQRLFSWWMRTVGIMEAPTELALPPGVDASRPYVLVANHPTLIDTVLLLGWLDHLTCVAKGAWYPSLVLGPLLRQTDYLPSPRKEEDERAGGGMLERMVAHLRAGHALLVFPEGTRSDPDKLHRFRRGAIEAAIAAKAPLVPVFLGVDRPFLTRDHKPWQVPDGTPRFVVEVMPAIDTTAEGADARAIRAELQDRFRVRFARLLREDRAGAAPLLPASAH